MVRNEFLRRIEATVRRYGMLQPGDRVVVAVSGGPDSQALLKGLQLLQDRYHLDLWAAHYNHRLRGGEAEAEAEFVKKQTQQMGIPLMYEADDGSLWAKQGNLEESAREKRYRFLQRIAGERMATRVALGHTANDQAETFFLWLFRGTGTKGLGGMPPVRDDCFIRPLIETTRSEVLSFLASQSLSWFEDSSNQDDRFYRNKIRHRLLPKLLSAFDHGIIEKILTTSAILRDDEQCLEEIGFENYLQVRRATAEGEVVLDISKLATMSVALQRRVLRDAVRECSGSLRGISFAHTEALRAILIGASPHAQLSLPGKLLVRKEYGIAKIGSSPEQAGSFYYEFSGLPEEIHIPEIHRTISTRILEWSGNVSPQGEDACALIDVDTLESPCIVRSWRPGDWFIPLGAPGTKKLKDFFIDARVPMRERWKIPLVVFGNTVAWVAGKRIDHRVRVTENTKRVVHLEIR